MVGSGGSAPYARVRVKNRGAGDIAVQSAGQRVSCISAARTHARNNHHHPYRPGHLRGERQVCCRGDVVLDIWIVTWWWVKPQEPMRARGKRRWIPYVDVIVLVVGVWLLHRARAKMMYVAFDSRSTRRGGCVDWEPVVSSPRHLFLVFYHHFRKPNINISKLSQSSNASCIYMCTSQSIHQCHPPRRLDAAPESSSAVAPN
jgi:hypothetical protein